MVWNNLEEKILTETPVIGILTVPDEFDHYNTFVAGAYVRYVEQAGAKVVPIHHSSSDEEICSLLEKVNGLILQGGDAEVLNEKGELTYFTKRVKFVVEKVKEINSRGVHFPIWAI